MTEEQKKSSSFVLYRDFMGNLSLKKKAALLTVILISIMLFAYLIHIYRLSDYQLLYGDLAPQDMETVTRWLDDRFINYRSDYEQGNIYIPTRRVHQVRIEMAEQRIPGNRDAPYGLIDTSRLSLIESLSGTDYRIALQRDLSRTLSSLDFVRSARVHLNTLQSSSALLGGQSATVLLNLEPGKQLRTEQLQAVSHLVAGAVSGLLPKRIKIVDSSGALLLQETGYGDSDLYATDALSYQRNVEEMLEKRARKIIETMTGSSHALITVTADIDFSRSETTTERFDPEEPAIRMEESQQQIGSFEGTGEKPLATDTKDYPQAQTSASKVDYELNKTTSKTVKPVGSIEKLSVTLLVPEIRFTDSEGTVSYRPPSSDALDNITAMVTTALALEPDRGDKLHLGIIPAAPETIGLHSTETSMLFDLFTYLPVARILLTAAGFFLLYLLIIRPILTLLKEESEMHRRDIEDVEPVDHQQADDRDEDLALLLKKEVLANPAATAYIVKKWIQET